VMTAAPVYLSLSRFNIFCIFLLYDSSEKLSDESGALGSVDGWGAVLQAGR
jgi:hypothetical protein